jgi:hypothetical protein
MTKPQLVAVYTALCLVVWSCLASAQSHEAQVILRPVKSFFSDGAHSFNLFGPLESIQLEVSLVNDSPRDLMLKKAGFFQAIRLSVTRIQGQSLLPIQIEWSPSVSCPGGMANANDCLGSSDIRIGGGESVKGVVTIRSNAPMRFTPGEYRIGLDLRDARAFLLHGDETRWSGRMLNTGSIPVTIRPIDTDTDRRLFQRNEAHHAMTQRQYRTALATYEQLLASNPNDLEATAGVGMALLLSGRYAESVKFLERVLPPLGQDSTVPRDLALAYVAVGDEAKAEALLRRYYTPNVISTIRNGIREQLTRMPSTP